MYIGKFFKWFFSSYWEILNRYEYLKKVFEVVFVLVIKSFSFESYISFVEELKCCFFDFLFNSEVYKGYLWDNKLSFFVNKFWVSK